MSRTVIDSIVDTHVIGVSCVSNNCRLQTMANVCAQSVSAGHALTHAKAYSFANRKIEIWFQVNCALCGEVLVFGCNE